uniref:Uncharacterized protein n=1 Tax=Ditylenchus dipsaci TaxID=166011 RepID=A0A915EUY1_9BILA
MPCRHDSAGLQSLTKFMQRKELAVHMDKLIGQQNIPFNTKKVNFTVSDYKKLFKMQEDGNAVDINDNGVQLFFTYLFHTGHLTVVQDKVPVYCIPNKEIRYLASRMWFVEDLFHEVQERMDTGQILRPDLTYLMEQNTVTVEKKYGKKASVSEARKEALYYRRIHEKRNRGEGRSTNRFISLGVHVNEDKNVTMEMTVEDGTIPRCPTTLPETPNKFRNNNTYHKRKK